MMVVHLCEKLGLLYCMSQLGSWVGGWVGGCQTPPPPWGGVGHLSGCGYAKILGGWVPELTPPPPLGWLSKTLAQVQECSGEIPGNYHSHGLVCVCVRTPSGANVRHHVGAKISPVAACFGHVTRRLGVFVRPKLPSPGEKATRW